MPVFIPLETATINAPAKSNTAAPLLRLITAGAAVDTIAYLYSDYAYARKRTVPLCQILGHRTNMNLTHTHPNPNPLMTLLIILLFLRNK